MGSKLTRDAMESELSSLDSLLANLEADDVIGKASLEYRRRAITEELNSDISQVRSLGSVTLAFEGGPVIGSRGIDAEFASRALRDYQDLISKQMAAAETGGLARSGPVPSKDFTRLNITEVIHGSFGFHLEERNSDEPQLIESAVKNAIVRIDNLLAAFSSNDENAYTGALATVDRRVFISVKSFYENLYNESAAVKIIEDERSLVIDQHAVLTARYRIRDVEVEDEEIEFHGELLGLTPVSRRFDFRLVTGHIISGQVGQRLSDDYLERLHGDERISGRVYRALMAQRTATRADSSISRTYTLLELENPQTQRLFSDS